MKKQTKYYTILLLSSLLTSCEIFISNDNAPAPSETLSDSKTSFIEDSANSSSLSSYTSESINSSENLEVVTPGKAHTNTGTSISFLNTAFNGNKEDYQTFDNLHSTSLVDGATRLNFTNNVQTLEYNEGFTTPSIGKIKGLVIPVDFKDSIMSNEESATATKADWQSVASFYYNSSYGQLDLSFDVLDWYTCKYNSNYYASLKEGKYSGDVPGVSAIIDEALSYYEKQIDLSIYDNNKDGYIDSLYIVYNHAIDYDSSDPFWWAYQYGFFEEKTFDGVYPYNYMFASYDFLLEDDSFGNPSSCNTHTLIHESGHMFGLVDYYDYDNKSGCNKGGFGGADLMDNTVGDHNAFSKISLGWIKNPIYVNFEKTKHEYIEIALKPFETSGDVIMICDDYDSSKGMFQSYFLLEYYTNTGLHAYDQIYEQDGVRLLRVHADLETYNDNGYTYDYYKYDNSYTNLNLIDVICQDKAFEGLYSKQEYSTYCATSSNLYRSNDSRDTLYYNSTKTSNYSFKVISMNENEAIVRIYRK